MAIDMQVLTIHTQCLPIFTPPEYFNINTSNFAYCVFIYTVFKLFSHTFTPQAQFWILWISLGFYEKDEHKE